MDEQPFPVIIQQIFCNDHKEFIQSCKISDLREINIDFLKKITNYLRRVMSTHELALETIQAKFVLLSRKYEQHKKDVKSIETSSNDMETNLKILTDKIAFVKEKQHSLINRARHVITRTLNCKTCAMSVGEMKLQSVIEDTKDKIDRFNIDVKCVNEKRAIIVKKFHCLEERRAVFQEWQLDIVKENLNYMSLMLQNMTGDILAFKETIDKFPSENL